MKTLPIIVIISIFISNYCIAQLPTLEEKLQGKDKVSEIMEIVQAHFAEIKSGVRPYQNEGNYKHWMRWGYYMASRTDAEGRLVDVNRYIRRAYDNYTATSRISTGNWIARGPVEISGTYGSAYGIGRVDRVAFHPTNANIVYIGTPSGGLFKSTNGGTSWTAMTDGIPSVSVSGIVVSHTNPDKIFILTGDGDSNNDGFVENSGYMRPSAGVFVSYDAGVNWQRTADLPITNSYVGYNLAQDPNNESILIAATSTGLYRTTNSGAVWTEVLEGRTYEVKFRPGNSQTVYATQNGEFWRSSNGGVDWMEITDFGDFPLMSGRVGLAVTNANSARVYLFSGYAPDNSFEIDDCGDDPDQTFGGVYLSGDYGYSFVRQSNTPNIVESCCDGYNSRSQSDYDLAIAVSHANASIVMTGGINAWKSTNSGVNWTNVTADRCPNNSSGYVHADVHDVEYNPVDGTVYLCTDGGIVKSTNHGVDWLNISDGVAASQIYHMGGSHTDLDNIMIGLQDNGIKRRNAATSIWDHVLGGDGFDCIYNWNSASEGYVSSNKALYRFWINGNITSNITPPISDYFVRVTSAIDDPDIVLASSVSGIYRSETAGNSWDNVGASGNWDLERCPSNVNRFYAAGGIGSFTNEGSVYMSTNKGEDWHYISSIPNGYPGEDLRVTDIGVRPTISNHVWITFGGFVDGIKVYYTPDTGETWINRTGSLPNVPINCIQIDANNNAYIGTDIGVFYRGASMSDWVPFWHRLPVVAVSDLELYEAGSIIRASTFGRGVWESSTYETCSASSGITGNLTGRRYYEVSQTMTCSATVNGGQNTYVTLKSGNAITLTTGFEARTGNTVHAYLAPCGTAILEQD